MFDICFGVPEMRDFWINLTNKIETGNANKDKIKFYKKIEKSIKTFAI